MVQQARDQFLGSFTETRKGTLVQKYKIKVVADIPRTGSSKDGEVKQAPDGTAQSRNQGAADGLQGEQGDGSQGIQGDSSQGQQGGNLNKDGSAALEFFNNFQDRVDYAVQNALINQSGVLVNTLSNLMKTMVDGSIADYQATGPVYLPGGVFPNYRPLVTDNQPIVQPILPNAPSAQPTALVSAPAPAASSSVPGQLVNPQLLMREEPQHSGQDVNRLTQDQIAAMFLPPQPTINPIQQWLIQRTPPRQQIGQPIQQTPPRQQVLQPIQQTPLTQQVIQPVHQQGLMNATAGFATPNNQLGQHALNQVVPEHLVHHVQPDQTVVPQIVPEHLPYPEWFERVPLPNRFKVPDFSKFSGQDAIKKRHDEPVLEYIQRFREMWNKCYSLSLTDAQLADLAFQGMIAPIREKFSAEDFDSLSHLIQKIYGSDHDEDDSEIAAAEWVRSKKVIPCQWVKNSGKEERYDFDITKADKIFDLLLREKQIQLPAGHTIPSAEELGKRRYCKWHNSGSHSTNDCKVFRQQIQVAIEGGKIKFDDSKRPMKVDGNPFPINMVHTAGRTADGGRARGFQVNSAKIINKYQRKYDKQQERRYEEDNGGFDPHWGCEFRFCWNEGMRLPSIEDCPGCSNVAGCSSRSYDGGNRLKQTRVPVHQRLGPVNQDYSREDDEDRRIRWCPSGIFTKNQKKRVQRLRNRERFQEVEQEISHRLKKTKPRQEWRVKSQAPEADDATADEAKKLANGKSVVAASVNMVFTLPAEFGIKQADVGELEEESAKLVLSPEQAVFEKPEGTENRHLKPLYINGYVNGKPMSKMMVDGGVTVNLMPYATFRKFGRNAEDLIKTNMVLKNFGGNPSETKGALNVELTVGSKTIPTMFFVIDGKGSYSLLLGRDWIHANCCIPLTMHQCLIQWQGDKFEIVPTDRLKSAGATYQRAMNYIYHDLIGWLVEVYIDDVIVKSKEIKDHIADLRKVFERTRKYGLKMNPTKGIEITQRSVNAIKKIQPPENKTELQKMIGVRRLRHYLLSNECTVICKADVVKYMLSAPILKGKIGKWIFSLTEFDLRYESPKAVKGQAIADFIVNHRDDSIGSVEIVPWTFFFDGSVCTHGCGIGLVIISPRGACFEFANTIKPYATNNQAEYEAVLKGLQLLKEVEADAIEIMGDSLLELMKEFRLVTLKHVSREQNIEANDLAQGASGYKPMIKDVKIEAAALTADDWRYEAKVAIGEVHEGICGTHQSAHKMKWLLRRARYFWPTMPGDCFKYYKGCQDCQKFGEIQRAPASAMNPIIKPWPFRGWRIDMIGMINPPSTNGQAEASNKSLIKLIKRKISDYPRQWHTRLAKALWSYRMVCHGSIQVPPYKLVYGHEAVLPWEIRIGSRRTELQDDLTTDEYYNLMADERKDLVQSRLRALA
uniref:Retrotransposon protein, putative, unclassified n=1 Tax=Oryza sativa subsp. japonica TaxID=39947 RepID=Q2R4P5_ORYSJ|nr:retrotransposon protein, putative, unclassified [Oryza sativa Japonica Group]